MATVSRAALPAYALPSEDMDVAPLGGAVIVRGLGMPELMRFVAERRRLQLPRDGETEAQALARGSVELVPFLLGMAVVLDDGEPVMGTASWAAFGAKHPDDAVRLFQAAMRLSGQDAEAEKKS